MNHHKVEYLLIGGYAVGFYGYPRATTVIDFWVSVNDANAKKLTTVLKEFGFDTPEVTKDLFLDMGKMIRLGNPPIRIEILTEVSGVDFEECYEKKLIEEIDGETTNLIDFESLKINKLASGKHKDLDDLENLPE